MLSNKSRQVKKLQDLDLIILPKNKIPHILSDIFYIIKKLIKPADLYSYNDKPDTSFSTL